MKMAIKRKKYGVAQPGTATYVLKYPFSEASANKRYQILGYASDFDLFIYLCFRKGIFQDTRSGTTRVTSGVTSHDA